jgi:hypothetical protein
MGRGALLREASPFCQLQPLPPPLDALATNRVPSATCSQFFAGGDYGDGCATADGLREAVLLFSCGPTGSTPTITSVNENPACVYQISLSVDCSANPVAPGTLDVAPPATPFLSAADGWLSAALQGFGSPAEVFHYDGSDGVRVACCVCGSHR